MIKYSIKLYNYKKNLQQNNSKCLNRKIIASNLSIRYKEKIKPLFIKDPRPVHFRYLTTTTPRKTDHSLIKRKEKEARKKFQDLMPLSAHPMNHSSRFIEIDAIIDSKFVPRKILLQKIFRCIPRFLFDYEKKRKEKKNRDKRIKI